MDRLLIENLQHREEGIMQEEEVQLLQLEELLLPTILPLIKEHQIQTMQRCYLLQLHPW